MAKNKLWAEDEPSFTTFNWEYDALRARDMVCCQASNGPQAAWCLSLVRKGTNRKDINHKGTNRKGTNRKDTNRKDTNCKGTNRKDTNRKDNNCEGINRKGTNHTNHRRFPCAPPARQLKRAREEAEAINVQRKSSQEAAERKLWNLAQSRSQGTRKNLEVQLACEGLRAEVKRLKSLGWKAAPS